MHIRALSALSAVAWPCLAQEEQSVTPYRPCPPRSSCPRLGSVRMDLNLSASRLGAYEPDRGRTQTGLAASFSPPVAQRRSGGA